MSRAIVKLFKDGAVIAESGIGTVDPDGVPVEITDQLVDQWANQFRTSKLALNSLKVESWDYIEFDVDGTVYSRNY